MLKKIDEVFPPKEIKFNIDGFFYPLVMNYLAVIRGIPTLLQRSVLLEYNIADRMDSKTILDKILPLESDIDKNNELKINIPLIFRDPLEIISVLSEGKLTLNVDKFVEDFRSSLFSNLTHFNDVACSGLLIQAYEIFKENYNFKILKDRGAWQFLRHCRNVAAHRGKIHLYPGEPKIPAEWRGLKITNVMNDIPLWRDGNKNGGLLGLADPVYLLWDLEKTDSYYLYSKGAPSCSYSLSPNIIKN